MFWSVWSPMAGGQPTSILSQGPFCLPPTRSPSQLYTTSPPNQIYTHTLDLDQNTHCAHQPRTSAHLISFPLSHFQTLGQPFSHILSSAPPFSVHIRPRSNKINSFPRSHHKNHKQYKWSSQYHSQNPSSSFEMSINKNYLDELQDTKFKRTLIGFIKEFKEFKDSKNSSVELRRKSLRMNI